MKTIVVTGHKGFIGEYLLRALEALYNGSSEQVTCHTFDLKAGQDILDVAIPKADVIFHLAAQTSVQESVQEPMYDAMTNIAGTIKVLKENPQARVVITGSAASKDPKSPYGISKLAQELYAHVIHSNAVVCRLPNVFAENDNGVVGKFLKMPVCRVTGDGLQTRDFVHVEDICVGLLRAMDWAPGSYELGSGRSVPILELAKATGKEIKHVEALPGEIRESVCENTTPDWKPAIDVIEFIKNQSHA